MRNKIQTVKTANTINIPSVDAKSTSKVVGEEKEESGAEANGRLGITPLTRDERKLWLECQKGVRHELKACFASYMELGRFLTPVRDQRLYREDFTTFENYCRKELDIARSTAYGYILEYEVITQLSEISDISKLTKEIHLRPIISLQAPERQQAMERLKAKATIKSLTPELLKSIAAEVVSTHPRSKPGSNGVGGVVAGVAASEEGVTNASFQAPADVPAIGGGVSQGNLVRTHDTNNTSKRIVRGVEPSTRHLADANEGPRLVFIDRIRQIAQEAIEACPGQARLLAKALRDIALTLEMSEQSKTESTITE